MLSFKPRTGFILLCALVLISVMMLSLRLADSDIVPLIDTPPKYIPQERPTARRTELEGAHLAAFLTAYGHFLIDKDIPVEKKNLNNYSIKLYQEKVYYVVNFIAKRLPNEVGQVDGGEGELGKDVTYWIYKRSGEIAGSTFYK